MPRKHGFGLRAVRLREEGADEGYVRFKLLDGSEDELLFRTGARRLILNDKRSIDTLRRRLAQLNTVELDSISEELNSFLPYTWFVAGLPAAAHDAADLETLGQLLTGVDGSLLVNSTLPAAYTYFGQFIAHEISRLQSAAADAEAFEFRTPALDLDSLFGEIDAVVKAPAASVMAVGNLALGQTTPAGDYSDLPRAANGEAQVADARNDQNLGVAQVHVVLTRFYGRVLAARQNDAVAARRETVRHVQYAILTDYLEKLIDPVVYEDVREKGPLLINSNPFLIPIEFAIACFRVAHSMPRRFYLTWSGTSGANQRSLLLNTYFLGCGQLAPAGADGTGDRHLDSTWPVDWPHMIPVPQFPGPTPNRANALGSSLPQDFGTLSTALIDTLYSAAGPVSPPQLGTCAQHLEGPTFNLAVQTLLRGLHTGLPDAQHFHAGAQSALALAGGAPLPALLSGAEIGQTLSADLNAFLATPAGTVFRTSTPLWFYCLREAAAPPAGGNRFGPLASRVIMETIFAAIRADSDGILGPQFLQVPFSPSPDWSNQNAEFGLAELVAAAIAADAPPA